MDRSGTVSLTRQPRGTWTLKYDVSTSLPSAGETSGLPPALGLPLPPEPSEPAGADGVGSAPAEPPSQAPRSSVSAVSVAARLALTRPRDLSLTMVPVVVWSTDDRCGLGAATNLHLADGGRPKSDPGEAAWRVLRGPVTAWR